MFKLFMNLTSPSTIKSLLKLHHLRALKQLGQHFLIDRGVLEKIISAANLSKNDLVIEIGPGLGALTQELLKYAKFLIVIEKDAKMCQILQKLFGKKKNLAIINEDILKANLPQILKEYLFVSEFQSKPLGSSLPSAKLRSANVILLPERGLSLSKSESKTYIPQTLTTYKVIANIPYYITSPIIRLFLETQVKPSQMILMLQKEVAQRIVAKPPKMSFLAVFVQFHAVPEIISFVSRDSFWPSPQVDSAILKLDKISATPLKISQSEKKKFFQIVKIGFSSPRKQLINNLSAGLHLEREKIKEILSKAEISPTQRAQELGLQKWVELYNRLREKL